MRPFFSTASMTCFPSPMVRVIGFSHQMSQPASAAAMEIEGVPVRRRRHVDHVDVAPVEDLAEVLVPLAPFAGLLERAGQMSGVHVADGQEPGLPCRLGR